MLFKEIREAWWSGQTIDKAPMTIHGKSERIRCHIAPFFDDFDVRDIDDVYINQYIKSELSSGNRKNGGPLSKNFVIKNVSIIKSILEYAKIKGLIEMNPMDLIPYLKKAPTREFQIFYPDEIEKLIVTARPKWMGDIILLAYLTGMRKCEVYGLQWADVDFNTGFLMVVRSVTSYEPGNINIGEPKTRTSKRLIELDERAKDMLWNRFLNRKNDTWVFTDQYGRQLCPWYNVKYFRKACVTAGIPIRRFHDLRHTHITELVDAGIPLPIIQKRAGHSDINMTMRYTHISWDMQHTAVEFLNKRNRK